MLIDMPEIELNSIKLHYDQYGEGGEVLILLHGFLSSSKMWADNYVPELQKRYRVYAIDLRGHGNSSKIKTGCDLQHMSDDIYQFMVLRNLDKCILAGMSMGGAVAIQTAIKYPDKIKHLILMNPGPGTLFSKGFSLIAPILSFISQKKWLLRPFLKSVILHPLPRKKILEFVADAALVSKETWLQYLHPDNVIINFNRLKDLTIPTLVVIGEKDKAIPAKFQQGLADTIPKAVKVVLKNEGHAVVMENPQKVISEIYAFLTINHN